MCAKEWYDKTFREIEESSSKEAFAACTNDIVYTKARACQCIMHCGSGSFEVSPPATYENVGFTMSDGQPRGRTDASKCSTDYTTPDKYCRYVGDRICQCPDLPMQTDARGRDVTAQPTYINSQTQQMVIGTADATKADWYTHLWPNSHYGQYDEQTCNYECRKCTSCPQVRYAYTRTVTPASATVLYRALPYYARVASNPSAPHSRSADVLGLPPLLPRPRQPRLVPRHAPGGPQRDGRRGGLRQPAGGLVEQVPAHHREDEAVVHDRLLQGPDGGAGLPSHPRLHPRRPHLHGRRGPSVVPALQRRQPAHCPGPPRAVKRP